MRDEPSNSGTEQPEGPAADAKKESRFEWIGLLSIAIALYVWRHGLPPIYPGDIVALVVIGLILAYCVRGQ